MQISALKVLCPWEEQEGKLLPTENYCHLSCGIKMPSVGTGSQGIHGDVLPTNLSGVPVCLVLLSFLLPTADAWFGEVPQTGLLHMPLLMLGLTWGCFATICCFYLLLAFLVLLLSTCFMNLLIWNPKYGYHRPFSRPNMRSIFNA